MTAKRLLLVEDHPQMRSAVRLSLESRGWTVVEACSGEEALAVWAEAAPTAVVTDYQMGEVDGLTLARRLRSKINIPIVIFTWELTPELTNEAEAIEVKAVGKDDPESLIAALDQAAGSDAGRN